MISGGGKGLNILMISGGGNGLNIRMEEEKRVILMRGKEGQ